MAENIKDLGQVCITPEGFWDINKSYDRLALVVNPDDMQSYISRKPIFNTDRIQIGNKDYWQLFTNKVEWADMYVGDDGWLYIGDTPVYQITLNDVLGDVIVEKIQQGIIDRISVYMSGVVSDFINAITHQINRLIQQGIKVNNQLSGGVELGVVGELINNNNNIHSGSLNMAHSGSVGVQHSGKIDIEGNISNDDDPPVVQKYSVRVNANPANATITINGSQTNYKEFDAGSTVTIVVSAPGYQTIDRTITNLSQNETINVALNEIINWHFYIEFANKNVEANANLSFSLGVWSTRNSVSYPYTYRVISGETYIENMLANDESFNITLKQNTSQTARVIKIEFEQNHNDGSENKRTLVINQSAASGGNGEITFTSEFNNLEFPVNGETKTSVITSEKRTPGSSSVLVYPFEIMPTENWINVVDSHGTLEITCAANTGVQREADIVLKQLDGTVDNNYTGKELTIHVVQLGQTYNYVFKLEDTDDANQEFDSSGGNSLPINIISTRNGSFQNYIIENESTCPDDFTVIRTDNIFEFNIGDVSEARTFDIILKQTESNKTIIIHVVQLGQDERYWIYPNDQESPYISTSKESLQFDNNGYINIEYLVDSFKTVDGETIAVPFEILRDHFGPNVDWCRISEPVLVGDYTYKVLVTVTSRTADVNDIREKYYSFKQIGINGKSMDFFVKQGIWYELDFGRFSPHNSYENGKHFYFNADGSNKNEEADSLIRCMIRSLRSNRPIEYHIDAPDWITFDKSYPNINECDVLISPNTGIARESVVTIRQVDVYGEGGVQTLTYTFHQDAGTGPQPVYILYAEPEMMDIPKYSTDEYMIEIDCRSDDTRLVPVIENTEWINVGRLIPDNERNLWILPITLKNNPNVGTTGTIIIYHPEDMTYNQHVEITITE